MVPDKDFVKFLISNTTFKKRFLTIADKIDDDPNSPKYDINKIESELRRDN